MSNPPDITTGEPFWTPEAEKWWLRVKEDLKGLEEIGGIPLDHSQMLNCEIIAKISYEAGKEAGIEEEYDLRGE